MISLSVWFCSGFLFGIVFLSFLCVLLVKTHDYTIINGHPRWIKRSDKINLTYEQLKEKYK